jgi:translation initiation factor 2 beta subunit (eIF-2beta)/eIF-5
MSEEIPSLILSNEDGSNFLYLGDKHHAKDKELLEKLGITHILNVTTQVENFHPEKFEYKKIEINDTTSTEVSDIFTEMHEFIENSKKKNGKILVNLNSAFKNSKRFTVLME